MVMFDGKSPMAAISKRVPGARPGEVGKAMVAGMRLRRFSPRGEDAHALAPHGRL